MLKACVVCGRPSPLARCPDHAKPDLWHTTEYRVNRRSLLGSTVLCALCGMPGTPEDPLEADHVLAVSEGGTNAVTNLRAIHRSENRSRGATLGNQGVPTRREAPR